MFLKSGPSGSRTRDFWNENPASWATRRWDPNILTILPYFEPNYSRGILTAMGRILFGLFVFCLVGTAVFMWVKIGFSLERAPTPSEVPADVVGSQPSQSTTQIPLTNTSSASFRVPILMYHYIRDYADRTDDPLGVQLSVAPDILSSQLDALVAEGYHTISLSELAEGKYGEKSVILTFDDGYTDAYKKALPILLDHKMTATFFVVGDFVGRKGYMTRDQITKLREAGMEIGGHTMSHVNLANQTRENAYTQISNSLVDTEYVFSYPSGQYKAETVDLVFGLGVRAAVTTNFGVATEQSSLFELPRIRVKNFTDVMQRINEEIAIADGALDPSQRSKD